VRVAVLSDIHGNRFALEAVLEDIDRDPVRIDRIVCAGDLAFGGVDPAGTLALLARRGIPSVRGNTDAWVAEGTGPRREDPALAWVRQQLDPADLDRLRSLPPTLDVGELLVCHGTPGDAEGFLVNTHDGLVLTDGEVLEALGAAAQRLAVVCGHTHRPAVRRVGRTLVVNAGPVSYARDGDPRACYAILEVDGGLWHAEHRRVRYDWDRAASAAEGRPHPVLPGEGAWLRAGRPADAGRG
jgi:putative phosphoesterase